MTLRFDSDETRRIAQYLPNPGPDVRPLRVIHGGLDEVRGADEVMDWVEAPRRQTHDRPAGGRAMLKAFVALVVLGLAAAGYSVAVDRAPLDALLSRLAALAPAEPLASPRADPAALAPTPAAVVTQAVPQPQAVSAQQAATEAVVPPPGPMPDMQGLAILIRNAVMALQQANQTGNYSVLREIAAPAFQEANSPGRLSDAFAELRALDLDLGAIAVVNPVLYQPPAIDEAGMLRMVGHFDASTAVVDFELIFQRLNNAWRLFGIAAGPAGDQAPAGKSGEAAARADSGPPTVPDAATMVVLIRSAVIALNHANMTGNYSVLRDLAAPGFQQANSFADLTRIFAELRERGIDLGPIAVIDAQLFRPPAIDERGMLRLTGFFASRPEQVNFDLAFQRVAGAWRVFGIGLNTSVVVPGPPEGQANNAAPADPAALPTTAGAGDGGSPPPPRLRPAETDGQ